MSRRLQNGCYLIRAVLWRGGISLLCCLLGGASCTTRPDQVGVASLPATKTLPTATADAAITPPTSDFRPTLPPTWTPTDTPLPHASLTPTPTAILPTPHSTLDPELLANTYWDGDGHGSMWEAQFPDGSYPRFTVFPVNFWVGTYGGVTLTAEHEAAITNAIREIEQVVPIRRVENRAFAHITRWLMNDAEFLRHANCELPDLTVGCSTYTHTDAGFLLVAIWLRVTDTCFASTLLHELTHGLGIQVHSPHPEDIMYAFQTCNAPRYSCRDLNTLRALYAAPPYNPRGH